METDKIQQLHTDKLGVYTKYRQNPSHEPAECPKSSNVRCDNCNKTFEKGDKIYAKTHNVVEHTQLCKKCKKEEKVAEKL